MSESSGELLAKVDGVKRWRVQPTMVRGWKKVHAMPLSMGKGSVKAKLKKATKVAKKVLKTKKANEDESDPKKKKKASEPKSHIPEVKSAGDVTEDDIRRNADGHQAIKLLLQEIYEIDGKCFPSNPVFDSQGCCRLKFEGASSYTWSEVLEASPLALEAMHPS